MFGNSTMRVLSSAVCAAGLAISGAAQALVLDPDNSRCSGDDNSQTGFLSQVVSNCTLNASDDDWVNNLYKSDFDDGAEEGQFAPAYETTYNPSDTDPWEADVLFQTGETAIDPQQFDELWAFAKDGNADPAWYGWDLLVLGWNGTDTLEFEDLWGPDTAGNTIQGAISNITIQGMFGEDSGPGPGPGPNIPIPAPLALLGLGGLMLGWITRKSRA